MSAFLGPIHIKMYERILYQDDMTQEILDFAMEKGWSNDFEKVVNVKAPAASRKPLENIIDDSNIHGWLSEAVAHCERRFALTISSVLVDHPERLGELLRAMKDMGAECALSPSMDAEAVYQAVHDILLDGMPCDFPFANMDVGPDIAVWQVASCHTACSLLDRGSLRCRYLLPIKRCLDGWRVERKRDKTQTHSTPQPYHKKEHRNG